MGGHSMGIVIWLFIGFVGGWFLSKYMNTPKVQEEGRLAVMHMRRSKQTRLCRLKQNLYPSQEYAVVQMVNTDADEDGSLGARLPSIAKVSALRFYTNDVEVINEANWTNI
jgi:hypothetical protein